MADQIARGQEIEMTTIRDVGKLAGVSVATVSRLLNQSGYVSKEAEMAITEAIEKLNYKPSNIARSLAGKQTATVALMVPDILNPFFPEIARRRRMLRQDTDLHWCSVIQTTIRRRRRSMWRRLSENGSTALSSPRIRCIPSRSWICRSARFL